MHFIASSNDETMENFPTECTPLEDPKSWNQSDQEPELEVHSNASQEINHYRVELRDRSQSIASLKDVIVQQRQTISSLRKKQQEYRRQLRRLQSVPEYHAGDCDPPGYEFQDGMISPTFSEYSNVEQTIKDWESNLAPASTGSDLTFAGYSEDTDSIQLEGTDNDFQDTIDAIREEASRVDVVMALDQLHTLESEMQSVVKSLEDRSNEVEFLRAQLREKEEALSHIELELDLFKADAAKVKEDLQNATSLQASSFDYSISVGTYSISDGRSSTGRTTEPSTYLQIHPQRAMLPGSVATGSSRPDSRADAVERRPMPAANQSILPKQSKLSLRKIVTPQFFRSSEKKEPKVSSDAVKKARRAVSSLACAIPRAIQCEVEMSPTPVGTRGAPATPPPSASCIALFPSGSTKSRHHHRNKGTPDTRSMTPRTDEEEDHSLTPVTLFPSRTTARKARSPNVAIAPDRQQPSPCGVRASGHFRSFPTGSHSPNETGDFTSQVEKLHEQLKVSMDTSEELRKRVAMISRYYEGMVGGLQERVVELKTEKTRVEANLRSQVSSLDSEKRVKVSQLEKQLIEREREVADLRAKLVGSK